jgi:hypothetical protein
MISSKFLTRMKNYAQLGESGFQFRTHTNVHKNTKIPSKCSMLLIGGQMNTNHFGQHVATIALKLLMHTKNFMQNREINFQVCPPPQCSQQDRTPFGSYMSSIKGRGGKNLNHFVQHVDLIASNLLMHT